MPACRLVQPWPNCNNNVWSNKLNDSQFSGFSGAHASHINQNSRLRVPSNTIDSTILPVITRILASEASWAPVKIMEASRGPPKVKNKAPAPVQISAEQLLREAVDRQEVALQAPTQRFADLEELHEFQGRKRREFEDYVRRNRVNLNNWMRYAQWELEQKEFRRARSIFERALDVHPNSVPLWIRYCESESTYEPARPCSHGTISLTVWQ